jgi:hypothetical protein
VKLQTSPFTTTDQDGVVLQLNSDFFLLQILNITSQHGPTHKQEKAFKAFAGNEIYETDAREDRITGRYGYNSMFFERENSINQCCGAEIIS